MLAICLISAAVAGFAVSRSSGASAQAAPAPGSGTTAPAAPGSAQARADLTTMQSLLSSGSVSKQAALLVPPAKFAPGSKPIFPAGTAVTIHPGTLRPDGQQFGTVQASVGGKAVTLDLYSVQGHWHLIGVRTGAQTRAAVTPRPGSQPAMRLMGAKIASNYVPGKDEIKARAPVVLVHGFAPGKPANWGSDNAPDSMFAVVNQLHGTWVSAFDYSPTNGEWVDNNANGPTLARYIHAVSRASLAGQGNGKVIVVAHSMGGLLTRYAANVTIGDHQVADDIGMVITLGTPNTGTFEANIGETARSILCWEQTYNSQNVRLPSDFCKNWKALAGMSDFGPKIGDLKALPAQIPLFAIAGNETFHGQIGFAATDIPFGGDGVVSLPSALHHRPGGGTSSYTTIQNPGIFDVSATHGELPKNRDIIAMVHDLIRAYIAHHPAPVPAPVATPSPVLGGDAYWLADGGKWYVHDLWIQISRGSSGLTGEVGWNAGPCEFNNPSSEHCWGTAKVAFTSQQDGSLTGTYTTGSAYATSSGTPAGTFQGDPEAPKEGQSFRLIPVAPHHARDVGVLSNPDQHIGNQNLCQEGYWTMECGA
jgi:pimeloyl-ACP methyl ester carboxylesterase